MPLTTGNVSVRVWRALEQLPPNFREMFERNLARHAFRPIDTEKGQLSSLGWVNIRQMLDARLNLDKVLYRNVILVGLRIDRLAINQKLFRATLAVKIGEALREQKGGAPLSREQRAMLEDKVRQDLVKATQPNTVVHEMAWHLESGTIFFTGTSEKLAMQFSDLFAETFQVSIEQQFPFIRAQRWAERQGLGQELLELLPSPFSPIAPVDVVEVIPAGDDE